MAPKSKQGKTRFFLNENFFIDFNESTLVFMAKNVQYLLDVIADITEPYFMGQ